MDKHEKLNFPEFSQEDQIEMIVRNDFSKIKALTGDNAFPLEVLDHYIDLTEKDVFDNISINDLFQQYDVRNQVSNNGLMISTQFPPYKVSLKERGYVQMGWTFNKTSLKDFFAKLLLSAVPKYSYLNPL